MTKVSLDNRVVKILNHIQAGVLYCKNDPYFTILYANDYFYQMIGYEKDEFALLYSNRFADLVPDGISKSPETGSLHRTEESPLDFEYRMRSKDGKIFWVRDTSWYEKEHDCWYVTIMDITDTKNTAYERQRLEFYLNNMPNKIVICDRNASIIYKNKQAEQCPYYEKDADSLFQLVEGHTLIRQPEEILEQASRGKIQEYETRYEKDGIFIGHLVISDTIKEGARSAIGRMKNQGIVTAMLTGDARESAEAVARETGIDEVHARLLPQEKLSELEKIRAAHGSVMFVGDGINDAPVLAGADVGAAMGSGADAAIEAADVVFMTSDMEAIPQAISIAKSSRSISMQNVVFALVVKVLVMILGLFGIASMWLAVFADTGVAMLCVLNSIRILYKK